MRDYSCYNRSVERRAAGAKHRNKGEVYETPPMGARLRRFPQGFLSVLPGRSRVPVLSTALAGLERHREEMWGNPVEIRVAKLQMGNETRLKRSHITPYARKLPTLARAPSLDAVLSE